MHGRAAALRDGVEVELAPLQTRGDVADYDGEQSVLLRGRAARSRELTVLMSKGEACTLCTFLKYATLTEPKRESPYTKPPRLLLGEWLRVAHGGFAERHCASRLRGHGGDVGVENMLHGGGGELTAG